jgi:uncharacterized coiled-coil protein SlyX
LNSSCGLEEENEILARLVASLKEVRVSPLHFHLIIRYFLQLRIKDKQLSEQTAEVERLRDKTDKSQAVLDEMTKKFIDASKNNAKSTAKLNAMTEKFKKSEADLSEMTAVNKALAKDVDIRTAEIDRLVEKIKKFDQKNADSGNVADLQNIIRLKNQQISEMKKSHESDVSNWRASMQGQKLMINDMEMRLKIMTENAEQWYNAFKAAEQQLAVQNSQGKAG